MGDRKRIGVSFSLEYDECHGNKVAQRVLIGLLKTKIKYKIFYAWTLSSS
jgi:hypothetical protein